MAGVGASTAPPQAPPLARGRSAGATPPRGPLALAGDVLICCSHAALWACGATAAAAIAARQVCGVDSRAAAVMEAQFVGSVLAMCAFHFASLMLFAWSPESFETKDRKIGGGGDADATGPAAEPERRRRENTGGARGRQNARRSPSRVIIACMLFIAIMVVVMHVLLTKQTWMERFYMLAETALFHYSAGFCFIKFPAVMNQLRSTYAKLQKCGTAGLN